MAAAYVGGALNLLTREEKCCAAAGHPPLYKGVHMCIQSTGPSARPATPRETRQYEESHET
jgi:hypothetical protein